MLPALLASPASALYRGSGLLQWSFDDVTVRAPNGRRHITGWGQRYRYGVEGPLIAPGIGDGQASVSFLQGKSLAQGVAGNESEQKIFGYSFNANLLPPEVRRYLTVAPSFSREKTTQIWGSPAVTRDLIDESRGLSLGLALPKLPSFGYSRSRSTRRDASSAPVVDQRNDLESAQVDYVRGPLLARYRRDVNLVVDGLNDRSRARTTLTTGEVEWNVPDANSRILRNAFLRNSYQAQRADFYSSVSRQESYASALSLTSRNLKTRGSESYLGYGGDYSHSMGQPRDITRNSLTLSSSAPLRRGRLDNQLSYQRADGRERRDNAADSATVGWSTPSGRASLRLDGSGAWSWDPISGPSVADTLRQRLTYAPRPVCDAYVETATNGATPLGGHDGGSRQNTAGTGLALHAAPYADLSSNYSVSRTRNLPLGLVTVTHSVSAAAQAAPLETLKFNASYSLNWSRSNNGASLRGSMLNLTMLYFPLEGLQFSGEVSSTGRAVNSALQGDYAIGKTRLSVRLEKVELYTVNAYTRVNVTLSRSL